MVTTCPQRRDSTTAPSLRLKQKAQCMSIPYSRPKIQGTPHVSRMHGWRRRPHRVGCTRLCSSTKGYLLSPLTNICAASRAGGHRASVRGRVQSPSLPRLSSPSPEAPAAAGRRRWMPYRGAGARVRAAAVARTAAAAAASGRTAGEACAARCMPPIG